MSEVRRQSPARILSAFSKKSGRSGFFPSCPIANSVFSAPESAFSFCGSGAPFSLSALLSGREMVRTGLFSGHALPDCVSENPDSFVNALFEKPEEEEEGEEEKDG